MASLSGFPFRLTPLMAKTLSPMWMAPVLQREEGRGQRYGITPDQLPVYRDADKDASCYRRRRHSRALSHTKRRETPQR